MGLLNFRVVIRTVLVALAIASASTSASDLAGLAAGGSLAPECESRCGPLLTTSYIMQVCSINSDFTSPDHGECSIRMMWKQLEIVKCWMQVLRQLSLPVSVPGTAP